MAKDKDTLAEQFVGSLEDISEKLSEIGTTLQEDKDFDQAQAEVGFAITELTTLREEIRSEADKGDDEEEDGNDGEG